MLNWLSAFVVICLMRQIPPSESCNEHLCASLVTKCILIKACECDMSNITNCTCCKDCSRCLSKLYSECCSCVGMCPSNSKNDDEILASTVEDFADPLPELFRVLTEEPDLEMRWTTHTYSAHFDLLGFKPKHVDLDVDVNPDDGNRIRHVHKYGSVDIDTDSNAPNCSVAFISECLPMHKCKITCKSMGASGYRWFHEHGCCECIGNTCLSFGKSKPLCTKCPQSLLPDEDEYFDQGHMYDSVLNEMNEPAYGDYN